MLCAIHSATPSLHVDPYPAGSNPASLLANLIFRRTYEVLTFPAVVGGFNRRLWRGSSKSKEHQRESRLRSSKQERHVGLYGKRHFYRQFQPSSDTRRWLELEEF